MVAGTPPWQGARPWPLPAPLGRVCVSSCRGEWDGVRFRGAFLPITVWSGLCWDVRWSAGVNARACVGSLILGHPRSFWGEHTSQQFGSPALLWSLHGGFGRAAERAFYPGILLLPCIFIHCPKLEAPALALSIKRFFFPSSLSLAFKLPSYQRPPAVLIYWLSRPFCWGLSEGYIALG